MGLLRYIVFSAIVIFFIILMLVGTTVEHEYLHQLIFKNYGVNSTVKYYFWESFVYTMKHINDFNIIDSQPTGVTYPDHNSTGECNETCEMLHTQVEIVDHGTTNIMITLIILFVLYIMYWEFFKTDFKKIAEGEVEKDENEKTRVTLKEEYSKLTGKDWGEFTSGLSG